MKTVIPFTTISPVDAVHQAFAGRLPLEVTPGAQELAAKAKDLLRFEPLAEQLEEDRESLKLFGWHQMVAEVLEQHGARVIPQADVEAFKQSRLPRMLPTTRALIDFSYWLDRQINEDSCLACLVILVFVFWILGVSLGLRHLIASVFEPRSLTQALVGVGVLSITSYTFLAMFRRDRDYSKWTRVALTEFKEQIPEWDLLMPAVKLAELIPSAQFFVDKLKGKSERLLLIKVDEVEYCLGAWRKPEVKKRLI